MKNVTTYIHSSSIYSTKISQGFRGYPTDAQLMLNSFISEVIATPIINFKSLTHSISLKEQHEATPERLAKFWGCGLETTKRTLEATTHKAHRE